MALVKNTNSYATIEEANAYFEDRIDVDAWASATDTQKGQALVTATGLIDTLNWTGIAISSDQPLAFPRTGVYFDIKLQLHKELPNTVPNEIQYATMELAYHLLNNDGLLDDTGSVTELSVGQINLKIRSEPSKIPLYITRPIRSFMINSGSSFWWRAN